MSAVIMLGILRSMAVVSRPCRHPIGYSLKNDAIACRDAAYNCMLESCHANAMQEAIMFMTGALVRLLTLALEEEPCRAKQGLQIVLACALGKLTVTSLIVLAMRNW